VFGIGWTEFIVIALAFLIFLGPKEIPRVFNKLGRLMRELNAASRELRNQLEVEVRDIPTPQKIADEIKAEMEAAAAEPYEEMRKLDAELKRDVGDLEAEASAEAAPAPGGKGADGAGANENER
jgi:sec-independent protein translocase protein TatB